MITKNKTLKLVTAVASFRVSHLCRKWFGVNYSTNFIRFIGYCLLLCPAFIFLGCTTPEKATREADETAQAIATHIWQQQTGLTNTFDITRPLDVLTLRIALEATNRGITNTVFPKIAGIEPLVPSNGTLYISLKQALALGARHNRNYQTLKESVYQKAISLDNERYAFDTTFSGFILGTLTGSPEIDQEFGETGGGINRTFENGSSITGNMAFDLTRMIREDWHSLGWMGDLTASVPLLRGSSRDIVREPLTQAERNLEDALYTFTRYRQTYALTVAKAYYNVLEYAQTRRNSDDNAKRLDLNWRRAEMMFKAGRMDRIQVDQARTDLLSAHQTIITSQQSYEKALDNFKITLGLPPESPIALMDEELVSLQKSMEQQATQEKDALTAFPNIEEALNIALVERRDLHVTRGAVLDAERAVRVAADNLRGDLTVEGKGAYAGLHKEHKDGVDDDVTSSLKIKWSWPWDRRRERNAYRKALITLEQRKRAVQESEDTIKNEVRSGYRDLVAARALYENKVESFKVAQMRVNAIDLFTQSGRSSMRDTLDAARDLLSAQNALCSAIVDWRICALSLRCVLGVDEE